MKEPHLSTSHVPFIMTGDLLRQFASMLLERQLKMLQETMKAQERARLVTRKEAQEILDKHRHTLKFWADVRYLTPVNFGKGDYYRMSDLLKLMGEE